MEDKLACAPSPGTAVLLVLVKARRPGGLVNHARCLGWMSLRSQASVVLFGAWLGNLAARGVRLFELLLMGVSSVTLGHFLRFFTLHLAVKCSLRALLRGHVDMSHAGLGVRVPGSLPVDVR